MAVPAHDERDYEFAKKFNLQITEVVSGGNIEVEVYTDTSNGVMVNSSNSEGLNLNDLKVNEAIKVVIDWLEKEDLGKRKLNISSEIGFSPDRGIGESQCQLFTIMTGVLPPLMILIYHLHFLKLKNMNHLEPESLHYQLSLIGSM